MSYSDIEEYDHPDKIESDARILATNARSTCPNCGGVRGGQLMPDGRTEWSCYGECGQYSIEGHLPTCEVPGSRSCECWDQEEL